MRCKKFADENLIQKIAPKYVLLISPTAYKLRNKIDIYLDTNVLSYDEELRYLGHVIFENFTDDKNIECDRRKLLSTDNILLSDLLLLHEV